MKLKRFFKLNLTLFDGEASAPAEGTASGDSTTPAAEETKGEEKVVYGKQNDTAEPIPAATETKVTPDPEARKAEYQKFIQGDYKDLDTERIQNIIDKRFKETKTLEKQLGETKPILDMLAQKYGVSDGDAAKLAKAIEEDNSIWEQEAMDQGLTVEQYKHQMKIERENAEFHNSQEEFERQRGVQETISSWKGQSQEVKNTYPNFDLDVEIRNPQFAQVLKATGDVKTAYQAVHFDEILPTAMQTTAQKVQEATVNNIQSRKSRPSENGAGSSAGVIVKNDPSKWTDGDLDEVIRRVSMGETINL